MRYELYVAHAAANTRHELQPLRAKRAGSANSCTAGTRGLTIDGGSRRANRNANKVAPCARERYPRP